MTAGGGARGGGGGARAGVAIGVVALGTLTLAPVWRGHAADGGGSSPSVEAIGGFTVDSRGIPAMAGPPSSVVYPPPSLPLPLLFDHARHARRGIGCARCHAQAVRSITAADSLLPGEDACRGCHLIDRAQPLKAVPAGQPLARCDSCHPGWASVGSAPTIIFEPARVVLPPPALKFNHRLHLDRGVQCGLCHANVEDAAWATSAHLPKMGLCLACHDGKQASAKCAACHPTLPDGRLRTVFPSGKLVPSGSLRGADAHTVSFRVDHKIAGRDEKYCATCHKQTECTDCHGAGVVRPADFHPADYASLHAVDARRNTPNCSSCHRNQTFCLGCHQRLGVAPDPEGGQAGRQPSNPFGTGTGVKRFHPPGWVRDDAGIVLLQPRSSSHSFQARRNLRTCVSCHREESCLTCHSADPTRSMGVTPHPPGFGRSAACRALASRNSRACAKCHAAGSPEMSCD